MIEAIKASAGTGKTVSLVNKIFNIIKSGVSPDRILAFTFTVNAKDELRERLKNAGNIRIETMHSLFFSVLRKVNPEKYAKVFSESEKEAFIFKFIMENKLSRKFNYLRIKPRDALMFIGLAKNLYIAPIGKLRRNLFETRQTTIFNVDKDMLYTHYKSVCDISRLGYNEATGEIDHYMIAMFDGLYKYYEENKPCIDFDDMLVDMYNLLILNENNILETIQNMWDYILVDEFQDTNSLQVNIIKMMSAKHKNLFIIGDWKQSIYEWRGGNYEILKNIEEHFPEVKVSSLTKTYRNCKKILELANFVSTTILDDIPIETAKTEEGSVSAFTFCSREEEAVWIVENLKEIHENGETAFVLSRTNAYLTSIELFLLYEKVPYYISAPSVLTSEFSLDILCMLFVITANTKPEKNVRERLLKFTCPYVSRKNKEAYLETGSYDTLEEHVVQKFDSLKQSLSELRNEYFDRVESGSLNLSEFAKLAFEKLEYEEYMKTLYTTKELEDALEIAESYLNTLHIFKSLEELFSIVMSKNKTNSTSEKIKLLTIHASKGLEAKSVFIAGMTQGVFPSSKSYVSEEHVEAEKRLLYVAVTRAEKHLRLSHYGTGSEYYNLLSEVCQKINLTN